MCNSLKLIVQDLGQARPRRVLVRLDLARQLSPLCFGIHFRVMTVRLPEMAFPFLPLRGNASGLRAVRALRAGRSLRIISRSSCCLRVSCRGILPVSL